STRPKQVKELLKGKSLIWYNTLWDTMAGGHDDDMSLENPDKGYGYLINELNARIIQTDRPQYLIDYLKSKKAHR
ncbi:glycerophosphodiester phosphodiesterase, partial [Pseudoxanthomonas sp. SGD-10]